VTNEYASQIEALLSPLVGDLMAKMALRSQCKSLGILPEEIDIQHLDMLATKIGFALGIHGHREKAEMIVSTIKDMSSGVLEQRGKVKGTVLSGVIDYVSQKWGAGLAQELKMMTGHPGEFKPGTWYTLIMLESTLERLEKSKGQGTKSLSHDLGYQLMANLKLDNAKFLFTNSEAANYSLISDIKFYFDIIGVTISSKGEKEIKISYQESTSPYLNQFLAGLCEGMMKAGNRAGRVELKESPGSATIISVNFN
jgi:hypothetical protein